ncbi:hypothetical protein FS837_006373 [Tulasnella sp. UAMH 9824]|nr:hypothetical protein FS837_006373 [Tulasnella sp. UAMH 9824]
MGFLPVGTIRNLILNRSLRPTCEKGLYTSIFLGKHPARSRRLLKTFIIRPDLALLVRHLEFSASDRSESPFDWNDVPEILKPTETNALSMAKNIRSLDLVGPTDWIHGPKHTGFRDAVSKMRLTHLKVERMAGSTRLLRSAHISGYSLRYWGEDYAEEIRTILQAQPLLESVSFVGCTFSEETVENLPSQLVRSDVPRLRCLTGNPDIAAAFIAALPGLENLRIVDCYGSEDMVTFMERLPVTNRASISKLSLQILNPERHFWKHFGRALALFSNTETLQLQVVITRRQWSPDGQFEPGDDYLSTIIQAISPLSALRHLEFAGKMCYPVKEGMNDDVEERGRLWEYRLKSSGSGAGSFEQVGVVEKMEDRGPKDDLSYEKGEENDEGDDEDEDEGDAREKDEEAEDEGNEGDGNEDHE